MQTKNEVLAEIAFLIVANEVSTPFGRGFLTLLFYETQDEAVSPGHCLTAIAASFYLLNDARGDKVDHEQFAQKIVDESVRSRGCGYLIAADLKPSVMMIEASEAEVDGTGVSRLLRDLVKSCREIAAGLVP